MIIAYFSIACTLVFRWLVTKMLSFSLLKVSTCSSSLSRGTVLPDKREACFVKDFVFLGKGGIDQETIRPCVRVDIRKKDWHN